MPTDGPKRPKKGARPLWISPNTKTDAFELDEIYWFIGKRKGHENGVNVYIMTMLSREPRQIVAFDVDNSVKSECIQDMVDNAPQAENYYTDGGQSYLGVDFFGRHRRNVRDKSDTHNIEGSNADIRHYIAGLRRRSRCFFRKIETLKAVLSIFVHAYNKFGAAKLEYRLRHPHCGRDFHFSHVDFI
jgi:IS1 family transposase